MAGKVVDEITNAALQYLITNYLESGQIFLFDNNVTPAHNSVASDFNAPSWQTNNYLSSWSTPVYNFGDGASKSVADLVTFNNSSGSDQTYYGWAMIASSTGDLVAAFNYGSPQTLVNGGSKSFLPTFRVKSSA